MYNEMYQKTSGLSWIEIDGKNSLRDFHFLLLKDSSRGEVKKKRNYFEVPYSDNPMGTDYSDIYGEPIFELRQLSYHFRIIGSCEKEVTSRYTTFVNFLSKCTSKKVFDSNYPDFYFTAGLASISTLVPKTKVSAEFTVTFDANPYLRSIDYADIDFNTFAFDPIPDRINPNKLEIKIDQYTRADQYLYLYNYNVRAMKPRLSFDDLGLGLGMDITITHYSWNGIAYSIDTRVPEVNVRIPNKADTRLFTLDDFVLLPGMTQLFAPLDAERNKGKLVINLFEEVL